MDEFFDPDVDTPGKTYVRPEMAKSGIKNMKNVQQSRGMKGEEHGRLGHFILGIEQFDGEFFGLSEMEQRGMVGEPGVASLGCVCL